MSSLTTYYNLVKPGVADPTDQDLWGGMLNDDLDIISSQLHIASNDVVSPQTLNYLVTIADNNKVITMDATVGARIVTLPTAASATNGFVITIKKIDSTANTVTIEPDGSETIDGEANYIISSENDVVRIVSDGSNWLEETKSAPIGGTPTTGAILVADANGIYQPLAVGTDNQVPTSNGTTVTYETPVFSRYFESAEQGIATSTVSVAHGLGGVPTNHSVIIRCKTAEGGYAVGDEVTLTSNYVYTNFYNSTSGCNATNIFIRTGNPIITSLINGANFGITLGNWRFVFRGWR